MITVAGPRGRRGAAPARPPCNDIPRRDEGPWGSTPSPRPGLLATTVALAFEDEFVCAVDAAVHRSLGDQGIGHGHQATPPAPDWTPDGLEQSVPSMNCPETLPPSSPPAP